MKEEKKLGLENVQIVIGEILKRQRESVGMSQKDVADKLGYKNFNFISMLERSISNIPFLKIVSVVEAYKFQLIMALVLTKILYPENWMMVKSLGVICQQELSAKERAADKIDEVIDKLYAKSIKDYRIDVKRLMK